MTRTLGRPKALSPRELYCHVMRQKRALGPPTLLDGTAGEQIFDDVMVQHPDPASLCGHAVLLLLPLSLRNHGLQEQLWGHTHLSHTGQPTLLMSTWATDTDLVPGLCALGDEGGVGPTDPPVTVGEQVLTAHMYPHLTPITGPDIFI